MKLLSFILLFFSMSALFATDLTSAIHGIIDYLPAEGQVVKKGEVLAHYKESAIKIKKEINEVETSILKAELRDLQTDFDRCKVLRAKSAVSLAAYEDVLYRYSKCQFEIKKLQLELKDLNREQRKCTVYAPFDCKVIVHYVIPNSGLEQGDPVLKVERIPPQSTPKENSLKQKNSGGKYTGKDPFFRKSLARRSAYYNPTPVGQR